MQWNLGKEVHVEKLASYSEVVLYGCKRQYEVAVTKTIQGLDWRWTGEFLILNTSEQLFSGF